MLYPEEGEVGDAPGPLPLFAAAIRRPGRDVTLIASRRLRRQDPRWPRNGWPRRVSRRKCSISGASAPWTTPRSWPPFADTHRAIVIDEGWRTASFAAEISARITEGAFYDLDAPVARVCTAEVPIPYPKHLEDAALPQPDRICAAARSLIGSTLGVRS